jgi:hypothetical protein
MRADIHLFNGEFCTPFYSLLIELYVVHPFKMRDLCLSQELPMRGRDRGSALKPSWTHPHAARERGQALNREKYIKYHNVVFSFQNGAPSRLNGRQ